MLLDDYVLKTVISDEESHTLAANSKSHDEVAIMVYTDMSRSFQKSSRAIKLTTPELDEVTDFADLSKNILVRLELTFACTRSRDKTAAIQVVVALHCAYFELNYLRVTTTDAT